MAKKAEIVMDEYIDVLEKIKERITQAQYQVMTNANVERNILLCKGKDKMVAEYALKDVTKPMGVSEYKLSNHISEELQDKLPSIEDIEKRIN